MNKRPAILAVSLMAFVFFTYSIGFKNHFQPVALAQNTDESISNEKDLSELTFQIASLTTKLRNRKSSENNRLENSIAELAKKRYSKLVGLIESDAAETLRVALPEDVLSKTPAGLEIFFEKYEETEGELEVVAECDDNDGRILYYLNNGAERLSLSFAKQPDEELPTGTKIKIKGVRIGETIAVSESITPLKSDRLQAAAATALPNTFGEQKVLVLLVNFQDDQRQPFTVDQVNNLILNPSNDSSVTNFYRENSYQQTWLTGDVRGYFTLPINSGDCGGSQISLYAKRAATDAGINLSAYNKYMYFFPTMPACSYGGRGTIGGNETWINGYLHLGTISHELGHNFGLYHSRAMECGTSVLGNNCTTIEYGSNIDAMGKPGVTGHFQPYHKERLGWLNYGNSPPQTVVQTSGNYLLAPFSLNDLGTKAIKILKSTDSSGNRTWYHLEFRRPIGFDKIISSNANLMNGVMISLNKEISGQENYLLDMTPETASWDDPALVLGRSYTDSAAEITITPLSLDSNGAVINITFGPVITPTPSPTLSPTPSPTPVPTPSPTLTPTPMPTPTPMSTPTPMPTPPSTPSPTPTPTCYQANPSITINSSATQWIVAGRSASYTVTVANNNNGNCSNTNFILQTTLPSGWSSVVASPVLGISPGANAVTSVQITSPATAADGFYRLEVKAVNAATPTFAAATSLDLAVYSSLGVNVSSSQTSYTRTQSAVVTAVISANGSPMSGANVTFTMTKSNGGVVKSIATSAANGTAVFNYRFNKKTDPTGRYFVSVAANLNGVGGNGSLSFDVK